MKREVLVETRDLYKIFDKKVKALNGVSVKIYSGETLGIVGETGCGKSTLCRTIMRLHKPNGGELIFKSRDITHLPERKLKELRRSVQMIFQDPAESMNPRANIGYIIEEPLLIQTTLKSDERKLRAMELLDLVGLPRDVYNRYPHEFSGGQRQRVAIARALALDPEIIVCDEAVSALDVSIQAQVLNLLLEIQEKRALTLLFISHDLSVVRHMSDRVSVMFLGDIVELSASSKIYSSAKHPYTRNLIASIPEPDPGKRGKEVQYSGEIPSPIDLPKGCPYCSNCLEKMDKCEWDKPKLIEVEKDHFVACHLY